MIRKENQSFEVFHVLIFRLNFVLCIQYAIPMVLSVHMYANNKKLEL
jgi:hypothetical protein